MKCVTYNHSATINFAIKLGKKRGFSRSQKHSEWAKIMLPIIVEVIKNEL
jgi:hypothetical protein